MRLPNLARLIELVCPSLTQNAHVKAAVPLGFLYDCCQCVCKVLEQGVLLLHLHAQNTVQELPNIVVVCEKYNKNKKKVNNSKSTNCLHPVQGSFPSRTFVKGHHTRSFFKSYKTHSY